MFGCVEAGRGFESACMVPTWIQDVKCSYSMYQSKCIVDLVGRGARLKGNMFKFCTFTISLLNSLTRFPRSHRKACNVIHLQIKSEPSANSSQLLWHVWYVWVKIRKLTSPGNECTYYRQWENDSKMECTCCCQHDQYNNALVIDVLLGLIKGKLWADRALKS